MSYRKKLLYYYYLFLFVTLLIGVNRYLDQLNLGNLPDPVRLLLILQHNCCRRMIQYDTLLTPLIYSFNEVLFNVQFYTQKLRRARNIVRTAEAPLRAQTLRISVRKQNFPTV
jgi:hypothetical protein